MSKSSANNAAEKPKDLKTEAKTKSKVEQPDAAELKDSEVHPGDQEIPEEGSDNPDQADNSAGAVDESLDTEEAAEESIVAEGDEDDETEEEPLSEEEQYQAEIKELNDRYMRLAAEFENYKKRTNQEMQSRFKYAGQSLAMAIISGLDSLERAIEQANQAIEEKDIEQFKEFVSGIDMVKQQFFDAFKSNNIERSFPKGELFDPNIHEAMGVIESDEVEADHITEVFQAGYYLHERVIRPAMVQVSKKK